jgi:hypothetical protein
MQQDPLISVADTKHLTSLVAGQTFDIAQSENLTLHVWQLLDRFMHPSEEFVFVVWPGLRRGKPATCCIEALDHSLAGVHRHVAAFAAARRTRSIDTYLEEPRSQR